MSLHDGLGIQINKFKNWLLIKPNGVLKEIYHYKYEYLIIGFYFELPIVSPIDLLLVSSQVIHICINIVCHFMTLICIFMMVFVLSVIIL